MNTGLKLQRNTAGRLGENEAGVLELETGKLVDNQVRTGFVVVYGGPIVSENGVCGRCGGRFIASENWVCRAIARGVSRAMTPNEISKLRKKGLPWAF